MTAMPRLLFVDDEPRILEGIENALFDHPEWDATFVTSGDAALTVLRGAPAFDVLITDMRMPGMDGLDLLHHVLHGYPHMMRVVLSGDAEMQRAMQALSIAHQYLAKPCDEEALVKTIQRALRIRTVVSDDQLRRRLGMISETPHDRQWLRHVRELAVDPEASISEVARAVAADVGLATKIVQAASSVIFGGAKVTTVAAAVQRIGLDGVCALALAMELYSRLPISNAFLEDRERCMQIAGIAAAICTAPEVGEQAYLCALLHDLGTLTLRSQLPERFDRCTALRAETGQSLVDIEHAEFGIDHAVLAAEILELFQMTEVANVVRYHHRPSASARTGRVDALAALHIAEAVYDESIGLAPDLDADFLDALGPLAEMTLFRARRLARS
ncbi:MAG: HDOD domain-containing protein [Kofleriaceae bacterium]